MLYIKSKVVLLKFNLISAPVNWVLIPFLGSEERERLIFYSKI
jgi:hypothetical protein